MEFFKTHKFEVHTNRETGQAYVIVKDKSESTQNIE